MINDILDMTQITNGKLRVIPCKFSLINLIKEISKLIKHQIRSKNLSLLVENKIIDNALINIYSDPNRLKQILMNLLSNAVKFTSQGFVKIIVEPHIVNEEKDTYNNESEPDHYEAVKLTVQDTGSGIKDVDIPNLFKLFGRLDNDENNRFNLRGI